MLLTILIPAHNEEANLPQTVAVLLQQMAQLKQAVEILIVNDASRDHTADIANELAQHDPRVHVVHHPHNRGIGGGFVSGAAAAQGEWMILIPADLALDPAEIKKYLNATAQADIVVGVSSARGDYSPLRQLISWLNIRVIQVLFGMSQRQFNYISLYRVATLRRLEIKYWRSAFFFAEVLVKAKRLGQRLVEVDIAYTPRTGGHATGANWKLVARTARDMLGFWFSSLLNR